MLHTSEKKHGNMATVLIKDNGRTPCHAVTEETSGEEKGHEKEESAFEESRPTYSGLTL